MTVSDSSKDEKIELKDLDLYVKLKGQLTIAEFKKVEAEFQDGVSKFEAELHRLSEVERQRQWYIDVFGRDVDEGREARRRIMARVLKNYFERLNDPRIYAQAKQVRLARPPRLAFAGLARLILKPAAYKRYVEPAIADMHEEYFACLARGDERGAKIAVIKGNLYVVPGWLWALFAQLLLKLIGWIRA